MRTEQQPRHAARLVTFKPGVDLREVKLVADDASDIVAVLHGEASVRLESGFSLDLEKGVAIFDTSARVGLDFAKVFLTLAQAEFGCDSLTVETN